ncbi:FAR1 DNA-binding domain [Sesbania bispinosa]|nr:FAR1 DNA-binding domain [Sesbania bispinosa]
MDDMAGSVSDENEMMKGMEELIFYEEEEVSCNEEYDGFHSNVEEDEYNEDGDSFFTQPKIKLDTEQEILNMDLKSFIPRDITRYDFATLHLCYFFYSEYGKKNGFSVRKGRIAKSKRTGEILGQDYSCSNEGVREDRGLKMEDRKREPRPETRCNCQARFRVHVDKITERWYCTCFDDNHSHDLLDGKYSGMLPGHRKMSDSDIIQMKNMLEVGIGPSHIYGAFASQSGGYEKIGFNKKDMYNEIARQRRLHSSDAMSAMQFLRDMCLKGDH